MNVIELQPVIGRLCVRDVMRELIAFRPDRYTVKLVSRCVNLLQRVVHGLYKFEQRAGESPANNRAKEK